MIAYTAIRPKVQKLVFAPYFAPMVNARHQLPCDTMLLWKWVIILAGISFAIVNGDPGK